MIEYKRKCVNYQIIKSNLIYFNKLEWNYLKKKKKKKINFLLFFLLKKFKKIK